MTGPGSRRVRRRNSANAKPKAVTLRHGGRSALRAARIDRRSPEWRHESRTNAALLARLGGPSKVVAHEDLMKALHCARLELLGELAWGDVYRTGDATGPAAQTYLALTREIRALLDSLGLEGGTVQGEKTLSQIRKGKSR